MSWISRLLTAAIPAWFLLVAGAVITVYSGNAKPYFTPSQLPGGPEYMFGSAAVAILAGVAVITAIDSRVKRGSWKQAGEEANLAPSGGGLLSGKPDLTGTVQGRPVRARTLTRKRGSGGEDGGSTTFKYTLVETDLDRPSEQGLIAAPGDGKIVSGSSSISLDAEAELMGGAGLAVVQDGNLTIVGHDDDVARAVATGRSGETLRSLDVNLVYVGNAVDVVNTYLANAGPEDSGLGERFLRKMARREAGAFDDRIPGDGSTVSIEVVQFVTDADKLQEWTEAVVEIAEAYEEATAKASTRFGR